MRSDAAGLFAPGGALARALPSFEPRPQQARMAQEVAAALSSGRHLLIEAGTGIGKSLAYLVPAILWAVRRRALPTAERRVVVSTHTRALQEQLARKDLPLLERALEPLGISFRCALLMGAENYLCVQRLNELSLMRGDLLDPRFAKVTEALQRHAGNAPSGLRTEIPFGVPEAIWERVRRDRDICMGARGPFWEDCLYRRDLARSRDADLVIVNHALFFLDMKSGGRILPPHSAVILDEAHRVDEAVVSQLGLSVSDRSVGRLLEDLGAGQHRRRGRRDARAAAVAAGSLSGIVPRVEAAADGFFADVRRVAGGLARAPGRGERRLEDRGLIARVREAGGLGGHPRAPLPGVGPAPGGRARGAAPGAAAAPPPPGPP